MRLYGVQQMLCEFRVLITDLELDSRSKESHSLEQSFDIRVRICRRLQTEPGCYRLMLLAEFAGPFAQISEFFVVDAEEARIHLVRHFHRRRVCFELGTIAQAQAERPS